MDRTQASPASPIGAAAPPPPAASPATSSAPPPCRLEGGELVVAPFRITGPHQSYAHASESRIELAAIAPGRYRVIAVHNFHVEDCNPRLDECVAGLFLAARRADGSWEEAERFPVECRAVAVLATLDLAGDGAAELRP